MFPDCLGGDILVWLIQWAEMNSPIHRLISHLSIPRKPSTTCQGRAHGEEWAGRAEDVSEIDINSIRFTALNWICILSGKCLWLQNPEEDTSCLSASPGDAVAVRVVITPFGFSMLQLNNRICTGDDDQWQYHLNWSAILPCHLTSWHLARHHFLLWCL